MSLWDDVELHIERTRCRCNLVEGMSRDELLALGGGCKMPRYGCPALDKYRRLTPRPREVEAEVEGKKDTGWSPEHSQVRRA